MIKPRDLIAWQACLTPILFDKVWRLDIVNEIRAAAKAINEPVNRSLLEKAKSLFPWVSVPALPPPPTRPSPFNFETITWDIPFDPMAKHNTIPWFASNTEGRTSFTNQHRQYAEKTKDSKNLNKARSKVRHDLSGMI